MGKVRKLGVDIQYVEDMVERAKGRASDRTAHAFYESFLNLLYPVVGMVKTVDEVREVLQEAHWIEEDDIRQQCYMWMFTMGHNITSFVAPKYLWMYVRDWLLGQKVFQEHHTEWRRLYLETLEESYELPPPQLDVRIVLGNHPFYTFKDLSLYHRYMVYCFSQGISIDGIAQLTSQQYRWVWKEVVKLREEVENKYGNFW